MIFARLMSSHIRAIEEDIAIPVAKEHLSCMLHT